MSDERPAEPAEPTTAETVGRAAGLLARFAVRTAMRSKTIRRQVADAREEAARPLEDSPQAE